MVRFVYLLSVSSQKMSKIMVIYKKQFIIGNLSQL